MGAFDCLLGPLWGRLNFWQQACPHPHGPRQTRTPCPSPSQHTQPCLQHPTWQRERLETVPHFQCHMSAWRKIGRLARAGPWEVGSSLGTKQGCEAKEDGITHGKSTGTAALPLLPTHHLLDSQLGCSMAPDNLGGAPTPLARPHPWTQSGVGTEWESEGRLILGLGPFPPDQHRVACAFAHTMWHCGVTHCLTLKHQLGPQLVQGQTWLPVVRSPVW